MSFRNIPPNGFPALPDVEDLEAVVKDVTILKISVSGLTEDVSDLNKQKVNQITIAPFFNSEIAYDIGDLVYYNGLIYRCTNAHEGEWDADDFAATTIAGELDALKSGLNGVARGIVITGESFTIDSSGNAIIDLPTELIGKTILSISCSHFGTAQNPPYAWAFLPDVNKYILYGTANDAYTNATIDFVYM